jgi:hypothetical protein
MGEDESLGEHLGSVAVIILLGLVYVILLSLGTVTAAVKRVIVSAWKTSGKLARRTTRSTH